jgi:hypothetical protein
MRHFLTRIHLLVQRVQPIFLYPYSLWHNMSQAGINDIQAMSPTVPTLFRTNDGDAIPAANILEIVGGPGVTTVGVGNTVTINIDGAVIWLEVSSDDGLISMQPQYGYIVKAGATPGAPATFILPLLMDVGQVIKVEGVSSLFTVAQNATQSIF